jgi:hypothetical protein
MDTALRDIAALVEHGILEHFLREYDIMTQGNGTKHSALEIKHNPRWRMVAGVFLPPRPSVNPAVHQPVRQIRREQKVIESHAFVLLPPFKFVIPECPEWPVRMQLPHSVGPALTQQPRKGPSALGLD